MTLTIIRWLQLVTAILGLAFATSSDYVSGLIVFAFVSALIYELILFAGHFVDRQIFYGRCQTITEIVIVAILMIITINCTISCDKHILSILTLACGYILSALFIISVYERIG